MTFELMDCPKEGCDYQGGSEQGVRNHINSADGHEWDNLKTAMPSNQEVREQREQAGMDTDDDDVDTDDDDVDTDDATGGAGIPIPVSATTLMLAAAVVLVTLILLSSESADASQSTDDATDQSPASNSGGSQGGIRTLEDVESIAEVGQ